MSITWFIVDILVPTAVPDLPASFRCSTDIMAIFDCFTFFNEFEILELRIKELRDVVDHFVAVEAPITFSGHSKPLYVSERFDEFNECARGKLHVHVATDLPEPRFNRWPTEIAQRNHITRALTQLGAVEDDLVTITDADEIPSAEALESIEIEDDMLYQLNMPTFFYRLDLRIAEAIPSRARVCRFELLQKQSPQECRFSAINRGYKIPGGGWHFSYLSTSEQQAEMLVRKTETFSEIGIDLGKESWPRRGITLRTHLGNLLEPASLNELPRTVQNDLERWVPHLEFPQGASQTDIRRARVVNAVASAWDRAELARHSRRFGRRVKHRLSRSPVS